MHPPDPRIRGHRAAEPGSEPRPAPFGCWHLPVPGASLLEVWRNTVSRVGVTWSPPGQGDRVAPGIPAPSLSREGSSSGTQMALKAVAALVPQCPLANALPASRASLRMPFLVLRGSCEEVQGSVRPKTRGVSRLPPHGLSRMPETTH